MNKPHEKVFRNWQYQARRAAAAGLVLLSVSAPVLAQETPKPVRLEVKTIPLSSAPVKARQAAKGLSAGHAVKPPKIMQSQARVLADGTLARTCHDVPVIHKKLLVDSDRKAVLK